MLGQTLGHYCITSELGAGGMGRVFRARDLHLERDVALKVLPSGFPADEEARKRLRREAHAISRLSHPNIATVFDFDSQDGIDYLVMELVEGETLSSRIGRGPLSERDVVALGTQLVAGLAAAHEKGVVHRDLKPANLMVSDDGRLKILDFGLAIAMAPDDGKDVTRTAFVGDVIAGTLPYMAPEQLGGRPLDVRSDIYSVGAILYEMATARRAFPHAQPAALVAAILHETPPPAPVSQSLQRVLLRSLEKDPGRRYQSARELLAALEMVLQRPETLSAPWTRQHAVRLATASVPGRTSVAVLGFRNLSARADDDWISTAIAEMLTTELASGERLRTVAGENVAQMKIDLAVTEADSYGSTTLAKIRANIGADTIVTGSYLLMNGLIRLDVRLQDTHTADIRGRFSARRPESGIDELTREAGAELRRSLNIGTVTDSAASSVKAAFPSSREAMQLYSEGLLRLRNFDAVAARDLLEQAVGVEPSHALSHVALATSLTRLGFDEKAKRAAQQAFDLSHTLSREGQLLVEGVYREMMSERDAAVSAYRSLWQLFPDTVDYGLRLADAQTAAGRSGEAFATIEALRAIPSAYGDPRLDLAEANAAVAISDLRRQLSAAERAEARASERGMRLLAARACVAQGIALRRLGQLDAAANKLARAKDLFAAAGDQGGTANAVNSLANVFFTQGRTREAEAMYTQALEIRRSIGDNRGMAVSLNNLASLLQRRGDLAGAARAFNAALPIGHAIEDRPLIAQLLSNLGAVSEYQGDLRAAGTFYRQSLAIRRAIGDEPGIAEALNNIGDALVPQGEFEEAMRLFDESLKLRHATGDVRTSITLRHIATVLYHRGELPAARARLEEALATQTNIGQKVEAAMTRAALARTFLAQGEAARAVATARQAVTELHDTQNLLEQAVALRVIALAQLAAGRSRGGKRERPQRPGDAWQCGHTGGATRTRPRGGDGSSGPRSDNGARTVKDCRRRREVRAMGHHV